MLHPEETRPRDPRSRAVTSETVRRNGIEMQLECGHSVVRRPMCHPTRIICQQCRQAG